MMDKDQQQLWEAYNTGAEGNYIEVATDKGMELMTPEEAEAYRKKKAAEKKQAGDKTKTEGAFGGPGGNFDKEGWGEETHDDESPEERGQRGESKAIINALLPWLETAGGEQLEEVYDNILAAYQAAGYPDPPQSDKIERDDDYRGEDPPRRETDQDRYGYPGDR